MTIIAIRSGLRAEKGSAERTRPPHFGRGYRIVGRPQTSAATASAFTPRVDSEQIYKPADEWVVVCFVRGDDGDPKGFRGRERLKYAVSVIK